MTVTPTNSNSTPLSISDIRSKAQEVREAVVDVAKQVAEQVKENHPTVAANVGERMKARVADRVDARQADRQARIEERIVDFKNNRNDQVTPSPAPEQGDNAVDVSA